MRVGLISVIACIVSACGPAQAPSYPPEYKVNFMRACEAQPEAADGRCGCIWDAIEANVPPGDFAALERLPPAERDANALTRQIEGYALSCIAAGTAAPAPR